MVSFLAMALCSGVRPHLSRAFLFAPCKQERSEEPNGERSDEPNRGGTRKVRRAKRQKRLFALQVKRIPVRLLQVERARRQKRPHRTTSREA